MSERSEYGRVLLAPYHKEGIPEFARELRSLGFIGILASLDTYHVLDTNGIAAEVIEADGQFSRDGLPLTVSNEIAAAILADKPLVEHQIYYRARNDDNDPSWVGEEGGSFGTHTYRHGSSEQMPTIDLVCAEFPPLRRADETYRSQYVAELLRLALRGNKLVLSRRRHIEDAYEWLNSDRTDESFLQELRLDAENEIGSWNRAFSRRAIGSPAVLGVAGRLHTEFRHGENPWQQNAAFFSDNQGDRLGLDRFKLRRGIERYTDYIEMDHLLQTATHIAAGFAKNFGRKSVPHMALGIKGGEIVSANITDTSIDYAKLHDDPAYKNNPGLFVLRRMMRDNEYSGTSFLVNFEITEDMAKILAAGRQYPEKWRKLYRGSHPVVMAPSISKPALDVLRKYEGMNIYTNPALASMDENSLDRTPRYRYVRGGGMKQGNYTYLLNLSDPEVAAHTGKASRQHQEDMVLAWAIGSTNPYKAVFVKKGELEFRVDNDESIWSCLMKKGIRSIPAVVWNAVVYVDSTLDTIDYGTLTDNVVTKDLAAVLFARQGVKDSKVFRNLREVPGLAIYSVPKNVGQGHYGS